MGALPTRNSPENIRETSDTHGNVQETEHTEHTDDSEANDSRRDPENLINVSTNIFNNEEIEPEPALDTVEMPKKQKPKKGRVVLSFQARDRPRQPFMNQSPSQPNTNQPTNQPSSNRPRDNNPPRVPTPPTYYRNQVTQDQHQPVQLRRSTERQERPSLPPPEQMRQDVLLDQRPHFQPGQPTIIPNNLINIAYWAPYPDRIPPNVPACLAHLLASDSLFVVQQVDFIEIFLNIDEPNFYLIQNKYGQCVYYAYETTDLCGQVCCRNSRSFQLHVLDMYHNEIIYMNRPCGCSDYFCCYPVMEVYSPPLVPVGAIIQTYHPTHERFSIMDADENKIFKIRGPCFLKTCGCCAEAQFTIHALDNERTEVGVIRREYGGLVRTFFTNADFYAITFPIDLDVRIKAVFLGALFLVDYSFFESS